MKKFLGILLATALVMPVAAREKESPEERANKDYSTWLPSQGDFSFGFALNPVATFVGNMFNGNTANAWQNPAGEPLIKSEVLGLPSSNPLVSVMGSYMVTNQLAVRANVGLGISVKSDNEYVLDDAALFADPLCRAKVTDKNKYNATYGSIALGIEYRVAKTRPIQGVFGAGVNYAFGGATRNYAYGNAITEANQVPTIAHPSLYQAVAGYMPNARPLSLQAGNLIHMIGVYGTIGVEWFVAPKIAIGANVNVGIYYAVNPAQTTVYEGWNTATAKAEEFTELVAPASHGFHFGTDNIGANLYMAFYFNKNK